MDKKKNTANKSAASRKNTKKAGGKKKNSRQTERLKEKNRVLRAFIVIDIIMLAAVVFLIILFNAGTFSEDNDVPADFIDDISYVDDNGEENTDLPVETLEELRDCNDLSSILKEWATNSTEENLMKSKKVINLLLVGVDEGGTNSDVIILMSLNKETEKIYLTSIMRDSYTYISTSFGDRYAKINASYANGGAECLVETIQNDFKIEIDYYVSVNYQSFAKIVDVMGGIDVPVQRYEAIATGIIDEWGDSVHLNGEQALMFCRIRDCDVDADISRTRRQRAFVSAIIKKSKEVTTSQVSDILSTLLKYVKTDCSLTKMISLATQGIINKWYDYEIVQNTMPTAENRMDYCGYSWVWIVDYPASAKELQEIIYGTSNIVLNENRITAIDAMKAGNSGNVNP